MARVDITPDKSLIQKIGLAGYRTEQAIAELVDNSIDARLDDGVRISVQLDARRGQISVSDDGCGMDGDALGAAMTIAKSAKREGGLGRFGMGMKSACSCLGSIFAVTTSARGSDAEHVAEYDEDAWLADGSAGWHNFEIAERPGGGRGWHGTRIVVSGLKVPVYPNQVSKFKESFGVRYAPYLESGQASIRINTVSCVPARPDVVEGSRVEVRLSAVGWTVAGYLELLRKRSVRGRYGIHLTKNGRLIKAYEKFGFPEHPENARVSGRLGLDHVPVNFSKSEFVTQSREYREVLDAFAGSDQLRGILRDSRSGGARPPPAGSVFGYFAGTSGPGRLDTRVRADAAAAILDGAEGASMRGKTPVDVSFADGDGGLYSTDRNGGRIQVAVNRHSPAFKFAKNPLFLIAMIAAEARLAADNPSLAGLMHERNLAVEEFLKEWSAPASKDPRLREQEPPDTVGYGLDYELHGPHEHLADRLSARFQFTAMSTLRPHMHNLRRPVYTVHAAPGAGDQLADLVSEEFGEKMAVVINPSYSTIEALLCTRPAVLAVREYARIPGPSIAPPEKAYVDLVGEVSIHGMPIDRDQLRKAYESMKRHGLIDGARIEAAARAVKGTGRMRAVLGDGFP